jgi:hypothetical protein
MLTNKQLEQFINHPKFGKLLKSAIKNWKKFKPIKDQSGLRVDENQKFVRDLNHAGCCLLGAALYGKKTNQISGKTNSVIKDVSDKCNLGLQESEELINGFDLLEYPNTEAGKFANAISKIVI